MHLSDNYSKQPRNSAIIYQSDKNGPRGIRTHDLSNTDLSISVQFQRLIVHQLYLECLAVLYLLSLFHQY
jgi:hypothetical protein